MLPATTYTVTESWGTGSYYRIDRDGSEAYRVGGISGEAVFETPDGETAFRVKTWGIEDARYGYVVRDGDGTDLGWIADDVPFVGRRLAIKSMDDQTIATLGDRGFVGKLLYELSRELSLPIPGPSTLVFRRPDGHAFGTVERTVAERSYRVGLDDVDFDHRLALGALVVLNTDDKLERAMAFRERMEN